LKAWTKYSLYVFGLVIILVLIFPHVFVSLLFNSDIDYSRKKILHETDYQKLLEAGREILSKAEIDKVIDNEYTRYKLPGDIKIPKIVRRLKLIGSPFLSLADGYLALFIDISNRSSYVQVIIYPEDFNEPYEYFYFGDKELLPGLWYNDEEYHYDPNGYDKIVQSIMNTGKYPKK